MNNLLDYRGQRCLIAGCYSGMGEATARIVRGLGGEVVAADIKKPPSFDPSLFLQVDLRDPRAIEQMVAEAGRGGPIHKLFYCAGLPGGSFPAVDVMLVNFIGLRHTVEACVRQMQPGGAVASISSGAGMAYLQMMDKVMPLLLLEDHGASREWVEKNQKEPWFEAYSISKVCTILYTLRRGAVLPSERGIRLNCISPGPTDTPMYPHFVANVGKEFMETYPRPIGRNSTPEEQGWPLAFLNSEAASYISGENLFTDGGGCAGMMLGVLKLPQR
jgi:NAD(P)-dependent dehydrogenase (short-subunit alcohol dehydrogenase family)